MGFVDLMVITGALGADFNPLNRPDATPESWILSDWLRDLMSFWITEGEAPAVRITRAGREITRLQHFDLAVLPHLERLQKQRFGQVFSLDISDVWGR